MTGGKPNRRERRENNRLQKGLERALKDNTAALRKQHRRERRRNPQVVDKGIDNTFSQDVDMLERRVPTHWVRPDVGPFTEMPPDGELKWASEESLSPEEAREYE